MKKFVLKLYLMKVINMENFYFPQNITNEGFLGPDHNFLAFFSKNIPGNKH